MLPLVRDTRAHFLSVLFTWVIFGSSDLTSSLKFHCRGFATGLWVCNCDTGWEGEQRSCPFRELASVQRASLRRWDFFFSSEVSFINQSRQLSRSEREIHAVEHLNATRLFSHAVKNEFTTENIAVRKEDADRREQRCAAASYSDHRGKVSNIH